MLKKIFVLFIVAMMLIGCTDGITAGEVYRKEYIPGGTSIVMMPVVTVIGGKSIITYQPKTTYHAERWVIHIWANEDGERKTAEIYVEKSKYDKIEIGDYFGG